ncbi:hypothetical protein J7K50_06410 [bacterium]|nr:hypothetical protein [bacterium]
MQAPPDCLYIVDGLIPFVEFKNKIPDFFTLDLSTGEKADRTIPWPGCILGIGRSLDQNRNFSAICFNLGKVETTLIWDRETNKWEEISFPDLDNVISNSERIREYCLYREMLVLVTTSVPYSMGSSEPDLNQAKVSMFDLDEKALVHQFDLIGFANEEGTYPAILPADDVNEWRDIDTVTPNEAGLIAAGEIPDDAVGADLGRVTFLMPPLNGDGWLILISIEFDEEYEHRLFSYDPVSQVLKHYPLPGPNGPEIKGYESQPSISKGFWFRCVGYEPDCETAYIELWNKEDDEIVLVSLSSEGEWELIDQYFYNRGWLASPQIATDGALWYVRDDRNSPIKSIYLNREPRYVQELVRYDPETGEKKVVHRAGRFTHLGISLD